MRLEFQSSDPHIRIRSKMEEFISNNRKVFRIENPLSVFQNVLSLGNDPVQ